MILECESDKVPTQLQAQISLADFGNRLSIGGRSSAPIGVRRATMRSVIRGGRFGGYGLHCSGANRSSRMTSSLSEGSGGKSQQTLTSCKHAILFDFRYDGLGIDKGGSGVFSADGKL